MRILSVLVAVACASLLALASASGAEQHPRGRLTAGIDDAGYRLTVTSFAATRAYAVGTQTLTLVGSVRNGGTAPQPAEAVTLRMYAVTGLDYFEGATVIRLPAMEPGASASFRWKVQPTTPDAPLVAALTLEQVDRLPQVTVLPIQRFESAPGAFGPALPQRAPQPAKRRQRTAPLVASAASGSDGSSGWIDNGKVRLRALHTSSEVAVGFLWARTAGGWRQVAFAGPFFEALSAEGGQEPWWEIFKAKRYTSSQTKTSATLTVTGQIGVRWRCTVSFTVNAGSSAVDCVAMLSPRRSMTLGGIRLTRMHLGEGSFGSAARDSIGPEPLGSGTTSAIRWGTITAGMIWPSNAPASGWRQMLQTTPEGADYRIVGVEYAPPEKPVGLDADATIRIRWRMYALSPSAAVQDAKKITLPK